MSVKIHDPDKPYIGRSRRFLAKAPHPSRPDHFGKGTLKIEGEHFQVMKEKSGLMADLQPSEPSLDEIGHRNRKATEEFQRLSGLRLATEVHQDQIALPPGAFGMQRLGDFARTAFWRGDNQNREVCHQQAIVDCLGRSRGVGTTEQR